jgi:hypothetical protein
LEQAVTAEGAPPAPATLDPCPCGATTKHTKHTKDTTFVTS